MQNELEDIFSNLPANSNDGDKQTGAFDDIFAGASQPLAPPQAAAAGAGDKYAMLGNFYNNQNATTATGMSGMNQMGVQQNQMNQFQTGNQLAGMNPFAMDMTQDRNTIAGQRPPMQ